MSCSFESCVLEVGNFKNKQDCSPLGSELPAPVQDCFCQGTKLGSGKAEQLIHAIWDKLQGVGWIMKSNSDPIPTERVLQCLHAVKRCSFLTPMNFFQETFSGQSEPEMYNTRQGPDIF